MRQLHKHVGDTVLFGDGSRTRTMTTVGRVTFPSVGVEQADDPGLGTGAMVEEDTLLALALPSGQSCSYASSPGALTECSSMIAVRLARGVDAAAWAARVVAANPDASSPGGTYDQTLVRAAEIVSYDQMTDEPLLLAGLLALGAMVSLVFTLSAAVRQRRRDLAVLKVLGLTGRQIRQAVRWQATLTVLIALAVGIPLGVAAGRVLWIRFADNLGVITTPSVPVIALVAFAAGLVVLANAFAAGPASAAARLRPAQVLRSE
jgi:predicted lysophospholipase L1 biosynthesis ABC-type transport system permease subunit